MIKGLTTSARGWVEEIEKSASTTGEQTRPAAAASGRVRARSATQAAESAIDIAAELCPPSCRFVVPFCVCVIVCV